MPTQDPNVRKDLERLNEFVEELEKIKDDLKKSTILNKVSNKYERNLEKLIHATNGIINNTATVTEQENYEKLIKNTDLSLKVMQKQNKNDEAFQQEFTDTFGEVKMNEQQSAALLKRLGTSIGGLVASANVVSAEAQKDVKDTALSFATGPFGKMMQDTFAGAGEKFGSFMDKIRGGSQIDGQAHNGMTNIPREGSYLLDGGERVLSGEQNTDLTSFIDKAAGMDTAVADQLNYINRNTAPLGKTLPVFNADHDERYFDSLINNDDRIAIAREQAEAKRSKTLREKMEILTEVVGGLTLGWFANQMLAMSIWFRRFKRMPVLMSIGTLAQGMTALTKGIMGMTGISGVFGKLSNFLFGSEAKTNEERLIQANEDIERAVRGEAELDRRGIFKKMWQDSVLGGIGKLGKNLLFGTDANPRDAKGRFRKKDKQEHLADGVWKAVSWLGQLVNLNEEMLEEMETKGKRGGLLGMLGGAGKWILGALGLTTLGSAIMTGMKGLFASLAASAGPAIIAGLRLAMPAGAVLWAGFKVGEILNEKLGEWLNLDMDLGSYIGRAVFNFVDSITSTFDRFGRVFEEQGLWAGIKTLFNDEPTAEAVSTPAAAQFAPTPQTVIPEAVPVHERIAAATLPAREAITQGAQTAAGNARQAGTTMVNQVNNTIQQAKPTIDEWKAYVSQQ